MAIKPKKVARRGIGSVPTNASADDLVKSFTSKYGNQSISVGRSLQQPERIPLSVFMMDFHLLGGLPVNRTSMVLGERSAGKTMIACKAIAGAQSLYDDKIPALVDVEGTFDSTWAEALGVDTSKLIVASPSSGEEAVDMSVELLRLNHVSLVVVDSVAALVPIKEIESDAEDSLVGAQARMTSSMVRKTTQAMIDMRKNGLYNTLLFVNQYRAKIGGFAGYGEPKSVPGGRALEYSTSVQLVIKNKETVRANAIGIDSVAENEHAYSITKNKMNGGGRTGEFRVCRIPNEELGLGVGDVHDADTMLAYAKKFGIYTGGGSSWELALPSGTYKCRGSTDAMQRLYGERSLYWELRNYLIALNARELGMDEDFVSRYL